jgi:hypothetical protein
MKKFLWERRRRSRVSVLAGVLGLLVLLDYDIGSAMTSGIIPLVQNFGKPW